METWNIATEQKRATLETLNELFKRLSEEDVFSAEIRDQLTKIVSGEIEKIEVENVL